MKKTLLNKEKRTNLLTYAVVIIAFIVMQTLSAQGKLSSAVTGYLVPVCCYIVLAVSLNLLVGICGELSLGHAGFMGIGAFSGVVLATLLKGTVESATLRLILAMVFGGVLAGVMGFLIGIPVLRLRGDYLAIVTLAFGEIMKNIIGNMYIGSDESGFRFAIATAKPKLVGKGKWILSGAMGVTGVKKLATFTAGFCLILFTLFVVLNLINSKEGRAIKAVRDNRIAAESVGINITAFRMKAFVVSAFLAGMAGALYGLNYSSLDQLQHLHQHSGLRGAGRHGQYPRLRHLRHGAVHPAGGHARSGGLPHDHLRRCADPGDAVHLVAQGQGSDLRDDG